MLLGSWYDIFNFAAKIKTDFSEFSLDNPSVNISAGIALFGVKSPVATAAREAEKRLNCAKDSGRNKISAIEKAPMKWTEYEKALKNANRIDNFLQEKILSTATIYRLLILMDSLTRIKDNEASPEDYAWRAKLGYTLGRNFPPEHKRSKRQNEAFELIIELFGLDKGLNGITDAGIGAILALTHALYRNRE